MHIVNQAALLIVTYNLLISKRILYKIRGKIPGISLIPAAILPDINYQIRISGHIPDNLIKSDPRILLVTPCLKDKLVYISSPAPDRNIPHPVNLTSNRH
ncbi:hypothetical protein SDC9_138042 [bioreactor metagenome]|uniref:Uncharacterized protein n=1 Tax=bioreactor metagenome TaxID=1076179 RepID=A0A645DNQ6_9ZZZZ